MLEIVVRFNNLKFAIAFPFFIPFIIYYIMKIGKVIEEVLSINSIQSFL